MIKTITTIFILLFFFQFDLQAQIDSELLHKKWKVVFNKYKYIREMSDAEWQSFKVLPSNERHRILEGMRQEAEVSTFEFTENKDFIIRMKDQILEQGKWELQKDGKTIIAKNERGFKDTIRIKSISPNKIICDSEQYGREVTLIPVE